MADDKQSYAVDALEVAGGVTAVDKGTQLLSGQERLYHGTSKQNWEKIKDEGLRADRGGKGGASAAVGREDFVANSTGKVHVTKDTSAADMFARYSSGEGHKKAITNAIFGPGSGKRVKMYMNYGKYDKNFEIDADCSGPFASGDFIRDRAAKGSVNVNPDEIVGSSASIGAKAKRVAGYFPKYIKEYPRRAAIGAGVLASGAYMLGRAGESIHDKITKTSSDNFTERVETFLQNSIVK